MVEHVVLFRVRPDASESAVKEMIARLMRLADEVPGIVQISCGVNFSARSKGYSHALVVRFTDRESLDRYITHPAHESAVAEAVLPVIDRDATLAVDYEF